MYLLRRFWNLKVVERGWISRKRLIKLLGEEDAVGVIEAFGGKREFYLPAPEAPGFSRIVAKLGKRIAHKLCAEFGDQQVIVPAAIGPAGRKIIKLRRELLTPTEIGRRLGCTERYVYLVLSRR
jgi:hypothetical protein